MKNYFISLLTLIIIIITGITPNLKSQDDSQKIEIGEIKTIHSKILDEDRPIQIFLPNRYRYTPANYPVIYLLDGGGNFHVTTAIVEFLAQNFRMPNSIVVGIPNTDRNRDFTPVKTETRLNTGGADAFLRFLQEELFPYIEKNYRTQPFRILIGHSLTGMFAIYTLVKQPQLFDAYIAISPWMVYADRYTVTFADSFLTKQFTSNKWLYITLGDQEEKDLLNSIKSFNQILEEKSPENLNWKFRLMKGYDHGSVVLESIYQGLQEIYSPWQLPAESANPDTDMVKAHFDKLSEIYGYEIKIPEDILNITGYRALNDNEVEQAIKIFKMNVKNYPASANVYDSLGEGYEANGQYDLALKNYKIAYQKGKSINDPLTPAFEKHYKATLQKINK